MTQYQISREFNVDPGTVSRWFSNYNIQVIVPIPPKEVLEKMYIDEGMSQKQIASKFIVSQCAVYNWFQKYNIPTRGPNGTLNVPMPPKDDLISCIDNGLNQHQIAEKYDVSDWKIFDWCEQLGIPGMVNGYRFTTPEHRNWRDAVLERDNYICQECGSQYKLQSHHIKRYCDYPELEFDVDNGITLCKECHNNIRGREYQYIVKYEDIVLRDRGISDYIVQPRTIIESLPGEPQLEFNSIIDYPQEVIKL
jgi:ribosomal protein L37AE/L43A